MKITYVNPTLRLRRPIADIISLMMLDNDYDISLTWPRKLHGDFDRSLHFTQLDRKVDLVPITSLFMPKIRWPIPSPYSLFKTNLEALKSSDIIHIWSYLYLTSVTPLVLKRISKYGAKLIITTDTFPGYSFDLQNPFLNKSIQLYTSFFGKALFSIPDKITLYSEFLKKYALEIGIPEEKIEVIHTGIGLSRFNLDFDGNKLRDEFGILKNEIIILFVGLLIPRKGVDTILKTISKLIKMRLNIKMLVVGDGPYRNRYEKMALRYALKEHVIFTGSRKDIPQLMQIADIFFLPSNGEGLPGVIMEASASGVPTVASNIPCIPDLVLHGKTGFLAEPYDISSFVKYIEILINDKSLRKKFGDSAREHVKKFAWEKVIKRYKDLYKSVV